MSSTTIGETASRLGEAKRGFARPRLLHATSGSLASLRATVAAARLASSLDAELVVVHVAAPEVLRVGRLTPTIARPARLTTPFESPILVEARHVAWAHGALPRIVLAAGDPAPTILALTRDLDADLLIIGARSTRAPAILAAPTRLRLQRQATCRVLAIDRDADEC